MPSLGLPPFVVALVVFVAAPAVAEESPARMVQWVPAADRPVFQGAGGDAWDRKIRERGWILVEGGTYHLWYTGYNDDRSPNHFLGHATSNDGIRWARYPANPL